MIRTIQISDSISITFKFNVIRVARAYYYTQQHSSTYFRKLIPDEDSYLNITMGIILRHVGEHYAHLDFLAQLTDKL